MAETAEKTKVQPIRPDRLALSTHAYQKFSLRVPDSVKADELTDPELWAHIVSKLRIGDEIRVVPDNFSYRAELIVTFTDSKRIRLKPISLVELEDVRPVADLMDPKNYRVVSRGQQGWCVQRKSDGEFIKEQCATQTEADDWLIAHLKD